MGLGVWIDSFFQQELNKVEVGHIARGACLVQGHFAVWARRSEDVGTAFNELFC